MNRAERRKYRTLGVSNKAIMDKTLSDMYEQGVKDGMRMCEEIVFYMTAYSIQLEFNLGKKRLQRAMRRVFDNIDAFRTGHLNSSDYDVIKSEINKMGVSIR